MSDAPNDHKIASPFKRQANETRDHLKLIVIPSIFEDKYIFTNTNQRLFGKRIVRDEHNPKRYYVYDENGMFSAHEEFDYNK